MKKAKWIALVMAVLMVLTCFTGCSKKQEEAPDEADTQAVQQDDVQEEESEEVQEEESEEDQEDESEVEKAEVDTLSDNFKVSKLAVFESEYDPNTAKGGSYYTDESGKYTFITPDGSKITETDYILCRSEDKYFIVSDTKAENDTDYEGLNSSGLIDINGKIIIPLEYAGINVLNERYAKVVTATAKTQNEDDAIIYYTESMFSIAPSEDDILYKGEWQIFDMEKGGIVSGVSGTKSYQINANGNYFTYITDDEQRVTRNADGKVLDSGTVTIFENGTYVADGELYNTYDEKMFAVDEGYKITTYTGGYYVASKYADGKTTYIVYDENGEKLSVEFDGHISIYGKAVKCNDILYDFDGNVIAKNCYSVTFDETLGKYYCVEDEEKNNTIIDLQGNVLAQFAENDTLTVYSSEFAVAKKINDKHSYYSFKDKDFVYDNLVSAIYPWLVSAKDDNEVRHIYDTLSGESLISGYQAYHTLKNDDGIYVYAEGDDNHYDVYLIEAA